MVKVYHYDAFSKEPNKGNPAGVVFGGDDLTEAEMQNIALQVGFNETAFPVTSDVADLRIRYFTPGHEMDLCGHATMATMYALKTRGLLENKVDFTIETKAGVLPIKVEEHANNDITIMMTQAEPQFQGFTGSKEDLAHSIGLTKDNLDDSLPILYGSTGIWTLLVPIKGLEVFSRMKPNNKAFPSVLKDMPTASIHPFCMETYRSHRDMHARHFSSPYSGTIEDAVTGTASGVMGAYYATYIQPNFEKSLNLIVEQGQEIQKDGQVMVQVSQNTENFDVEISGTAVYVQEFEVLL